MAWTTPVTRVAGDTLTAASWNSDVRDNLNAIAAFGITGATGYTANWDSLGTAGSPNNETVTYATYTQLGKTAFVWVRLTLGASLGTGQYTISLPVTAVTAAVTANAVVGAGRTFDTSISDTWNVVMYLNSATTVSAYFDQQTSPGIVAATVPFTWASGDIWDFFAVVPVA